MNAKWLTTPKENVQQLQEKLGHAAKENKRQKALVIRMIMKDEHRKAV